MANLKQTPSDLEFQRPHPYMMIADRRVDDLSQLDHLTEDNLVSTLEQRYADSRYYVRSYFTGLNWTATLHTNMDIGMAPRQGSRWLIECPGFSIRLVIYLSVNLVLLKQ